MRALRPNDRVLLLEIPPANELGVIARAVNEGEVVALGDREQVEAARTTAAVFPNTRLVDANPDRIPSPAAYFTKIVIPAHLEPLLRHSSAELSRVLAPGGEIVRQEFSG